jgi:hypothetical protein
MGYILRNMKAAPGWRVVFREDKGEGKPNVERTVVPGSAEYQEIGLNPTLSKADAEKVLDRVRKHREAVRHATRLAKIDERIAKQNAVTAAWLPNWIVEEFEREIIPEQQIRDDRWRIAKTIIASLTIPPDEWRWRPKAIFEAFKKRGGVGGRIVSNFFIGGRTDRTDRTVSPTLPYTYTFSKRGERWIRSDRSAFEDFFNEFNLCITFIHPPTGARTRKSTRNLRTKFLSVQPADQARFRKPLCKEVRHHFS